MTSGSAIVQFRLEHPEYSDSSGDSRVDPRLLRLAAGRLCRRGRGYRCHLGGGGATVQGQINILPGAHLTPAEVEEIKETCEAFGLDPVVIPDISCALDGHIDETVSPLSMGGAPVARLRLAGRSAATLYFGDSLWEAAGVLTEKFGIPTYGFTSVTGLAETDALMTTLSALSGKPVPEKFRRWRSRLMDALVDSHYQFGLKKVALALESDHLKGLTTFFAGLGCEIQVAIAATRTRGLERLPVDNLFVGDLEDLEEQRQARTSWSQTPTVVRRPGSSA